jgi:hypothetical protein
MLGLSAHAERRCGILALADSGAMGTGVGIRSRSARPLWPATGSARVNRPDWPSLPTAALDNAAERSELCELPATVPAYRYERAAAKSARNSASLRLSAGSWLSG